MWLAVAVGLLLVVMFLPAFMGCFRLWLKRRHSCLEDWCPELPPRVDHRCIANGSDLLQKNEVHAGTVTRFMSYTP